MSGTSFGSSSDKEVRPIDIKQIKLEEKESNDAAYANESSRRSHKGIAEGNRLMTEDRKAQREERKVAREIELFKLLDHTLIEFKEIMGSMAKRRKSTLKA